jgi:PAS domain S-box-containing protein
MSEDIGLGKLKINEGDFEEGWLNTVFGFMNAGLVITDAKKKDNPIVYANPKFYEMTGYEEKDILGKNCRFLQGKDTDKMMVKQIKKTVEGRKKGKFILKNYRKDGTPFWNELHIAPIWNDKAELTHFIGIQHDVSDEIGYALEKD